ncbi:uncharacterized protein K02A2.6-like [Dreissena polymorpha]|uniref:uncharacterized protein K02A2.6-like n=1 Tax=Dreissena polymorpha TaxID=45954 RepID=UPI002263B703|nr:uncharacterized protein K02A2.6-like [Dreissena polymorpha]
MAFADAVKKATQELLDKGVIRKSTSPWASPIVLVKKKNGEVRPCVDYRKVNKLVKPDGFPIPRVLDCLDAVANATLFSTFDLTSGYFQIPLKEEDIPKSAFVCKYGQFEMLRLPFGLNSAASTFQRTMELALQGLQWETCLIYIDDIIVFGSDFRQHMERIQKVLERMEAAGLKLRPDKCEMLKEEVVFLRHMVSKEGVRPIPANIAKIVEWPVPKNAKEVRLFTAMASYYRRFVKDFASKVKPMTELTKKDKKFKWDDRCQQSFEELKRELISPEIMGNPMNDGGEFRLDVDASDLGIGAVLHQVQGDRERVIAKCIRRSHNMIASGVYAKILGKEGTLVPNNDSKESNTVRAVNNDRDNLPSTSKAPDDTNHFSKYVEILAVPDQTAETCASRILNDFIARWGCPLSILSDLGRNYESSVFRELCKILEIKKIRTSPKNPKCHGQAERFNKTLVRMIKAYLCGEQDQWDKNLGCLAAAYRSTPHESTGMTPNLLMMGREVRHPSELEFSRNPNSEETRSFVDYVAALKEKMHHAHQVAREHLSVATKRQKEIYDKRQCVHSYEPGDFIWLLEESRKPGITHKLEMSYEGPFVVKQSLSNVNFRIQLDRHGKKVVNHKLKPYEGTNAPKRLQTERRKLKMNKE